MGAEADPLRQSALRESNPPVQLGALAPRPLGQGHVMCREEQKQVTRVGFEPNLDGLKDRRPHQKSNGPMERNGVWQHSRHERGDLWPTDRSRSLPRSAHGVAEEG